jgi:antitoxin HicB
MLYPIELEPDDNDTLLVTCKAFPEVSTYGTDEADAWSHAIDALEEAIAARIAAGAAIPPPRRTASRLTVRLPLLTTLKVALYTALQRQGISRAELARRLGWHREQVDRLFRLDHASRLDQLELAFRALHQDVDVRVRKTTETARVS